MPVTLEHIVAARRRSVAEAKARADMAALRQRAAGRISPPGFRAALAAARERSRPGLIAELKKASPSKGLIRRDFDAAELAGSLSRAGASALSVLTEEEHFQGSLRNLEVAAEVSGLPCLRKDFMVDEFQLVEARAAGASAVLLIVAALADAELKRLQQAAAEAGLDVLCEAHDERELERALELEFAIVGVNNRDLRTFRVDLRTAERLAERIPAGMIKVAESGIESAADIRRLSDAGYDAFLVGESLMRAAEPGAALRELLQGSSATPQAVNAALKAGS